MRWVMVCLLLLGCAHQPPVGHPVQVEDVPFALNGRISVKHNGTRDSAGLRWEHRLEADEILLLTPLGQSAARIYRDNALATLDVGARHYQDADVESLMMQVLGWRLEMSRLHHWVLGMLADGGVVLERDKLNRLSILREDGWEVRYLAYADDQVNSLPARMQLSRENLQLMLLIDEWDWKIK
jgi:outer membrane lipoprotein LolB